MNKKIGLLFHILLSLMLLAGCTFEQRSACVEEGEEISVDIEFSVADLAPAPRAVEGGDLREEAEVVTLTLFADGPTKERFDFDFTDSNIFSGLFATRITLDEGSYSFYAVANAPDGLLTSGQFYTKAELDDIVVSSSTEMPTAPFIMTGESENIQISTAEKVPIRLERLVAKIDLISTAPDFTLIGAVLYQAPQSAHLMPHISKSGKDEWPILPTPLTRANYKTEVAASGNQILNSLYCYESFNQDAQTFEDNVSLVVHGAFKGQEGYYRIDIRDFRGRQWIRRNTKYQISISDVTGYGYTSIDKAMQNKPANMVLGIATRSDEDNISEYIVFDGEYFLGSSQSILEVNYDPTKEEVYEGDTLPAIFPPYEMTIRTNAPNDWEYELEGDVLRTYKHFLFGELTDYVWMFVNRDDTDRSKLLFDFYNLHSTDEETNYGIFPDNREAKVTIKAKGRPNLKLEIPIIQYNLPSYYARIEADPNLFVSNGKQTDAFVSDIATTFEDIGWRIVDIHSSVGDASWITTWPAIGEVIYGASRLRIESQPLPSDVFYREATIVLKTLPILPGVPEFTKVIRVISGLDLTYRIVYPSTSLKYDDLKRTTRVIETPLNQEEAYTYTVHVQSTQKWKVLASHPWITVTQPNFVGGSYNTSFTVTVPVNPGNGTDIGGLKKAREGYVDILGDQMHQRIMVYQGGYVQIGKDIWMDRNLQSSRFPNGFDSGAHYDSRAGYIYGYYVKTPPATPYPLHQILYPAAVPIAFDGAMTACYGKHRLPTPDITIIGNTKAYNTTRGHLFNRYDFTMNSDGYFVWGLPIPMMINWQGNSVMPYDCWNSNYKVTDDILVDNSKKGIMDPCPVGWRTPSYLELRNLSTFLNKGVRRYFSGLEDINAPRNADDLNNGLFFYNADKVSCWFPFAGYRQSTITSNTGKLTSRGEESRYNSNGIPDRTNPFYLGYSATRADMQQNDRYFGYSVRCIKE